MALAGFDQATMPVQDPITIPDRRLSGLLDKPGSEPDNLAWLIGPAWVDFMTRVTNVLNKVPVRINSVQLVNQNATISPTDFSGGTLNAGLYRVTYYARITQAAGVSSSLTVTLDWTDGGVSQSFSGAAITGNTTQTYQTDSLLIRSDQISPVRYSTTYASAGVPEMRFSLFVSIEQVQA